MQNEPIEIRAKLASWSRSIDLAGFTTTVSGRTAVALPITFEARDNGLNLEPMCRLTPEAAQRLMDDLWTCGLRPTEGAGSAGSLAATERHLADMRTLVSKALDVTL